MWQVVLIMIHFSGNDIVALWELPARYQSMEVCQQAAQKHLVARLPLGHVPMAICLDPPHGEFIVLNREK